MAIKRTKNHNETCTSLLAISSKVPAFLNVVDIAGLVKGASEGQGLGNSFLSHINACDGIFHLCRKSSVNIRCSTRVNSFLLVLTLIYIYREDEHDGNIFDGIFIKLYYYNTYIRIYVF